MSDPWSMQRMMSDAAVVQQARQLMGNPEQMAQFLPGLHPLLQGMKRDPGLMQHVMQQQQQIFSDPWFPQKLQQILSNPQASQAMVEMLGDPEMVQGVMPDLTA